MISDEYGVPVMLTTNSPLNTEVNFLKRQGFSWVVLPRRAFLGLTNPLNYAIVDSHVAPRAMPIEGTPADLWALLHIRLQDCLKALSENAPSVDN